MFPGTGQGSVWTEHWRHRALIPAVALLVGPAVNQGAFHRQRDRQRPECLCMSVCVINVCHSAGVGPGVCLLNRGLASVKEINVYCAHAYTGGCGRACEGVCVLAVCFATMLPRCPQTDTHTCKNRDIHIHTHTHTHTQIHMDAIIQTHTHAHTKPD